MYATGHQELLLLFCSQISKLRITSVSGGVRIRALSITSRTFGHLNYRAMNRSIGYSLAMSISNTYQVSLSCVCVCVQCQVTGILLPDLLQQTEYTNSEHRQCCHFTLFCIYICAMSTSTNYRCWQICIHL
uniref:Uncharacterized protein n=1 Tax=Cacopsylla melanoneura TaxID=428564 RepID=A0A8D8Z2S5_9HEMI